MAELSGGLKREIVLEEDRRQIRIISKGIGTNRVQFDDMSEIDIEATTNGGDRDE